MSSATNETFSPRNISVLGLLLFVALVLGEGVFNPNNSQPAMANPIGSSEDIAMRLKPVVTLEEMRGNLQMAAASADDANKTPEMLYTGGCSACHATGAAGAPKLDDRTAWIGRIGKGVEGLLASAINGIGAMPAKGGSRYSDDQIRAVVEYMMEKAK
mgnify:FL=1